MAQPTAADPARTVAPKGTEHITALGPFHRHRASAVSSPSSATSNGESSRERLNPNATPLNALPHAETVAEQMGE